MGVRIAKGGVGKSIPSEKGSPYSLPGNLTVEIVYDNTLSRHRTEAYSIHSPSSSLFIILGCLVRLLHQTRVASESKKKERQANLSWRPLLVRRNHQRFEYGEVAEAPME